MLFFSLLLVAILGSAQAANPFDAPGSAGVGVGWVTKTQGLVGSALQVDDGSLRVHATPVAGPQPRACQARPTPVKGRVRVRGQWKLDGIEADRTWEGARLMLAFMDASGVMLPGHDGWTTVASGQGSRDWESLDHVVNPPANAAQVKVCVDVFKANVGEVRFRDIDLPAASHEPKNVLWIVIDTLRADALGTYGGTDGISPNIDALAQSSLVYDKAWTQYTWTNPSTVSAFSSEYARTHDWEYNFGQSHLDEVHAMSSQIRTLAEVLQDQGFLTQGWYANGYLKPQIGYRRGFYVWSYGRDETVIESAVDDIGRWDDDGAPNFTYVHLMTMHVPLRPSDEAQRAAGVNVSVPSDGIVYYADAATSMLETDYDAMFADAYHASVYDADALVGQVLDALTDCGHADDTLVVLSADHGELLGEHGLLGHGNYVYEPLTWVPLMVRAPHKAPRHVTKRVGQVIDIAPTILSWLDLEGQKPDSWEGLDLFVSAPGRTAISERNDLLAVTVDGRWKAIEADDSGRFQAGFDLQQDPAEENDLHKDTAGIFAAHTAAATWRQRTPELVNDGAPIVLDESDEDRTIEMLKQLGYTQ